MSADGEPDRATEPRLAGVLAELVVREPIFHRPEQGTTRPDFERMTDAVFWETGASGRRYDRAFVLAELERRLAQPVHEELAAHDFHCQELAPDLYLLTYTLAQGARVTRRVTIWRRGADGWKIVYHQGTIVVAP